MSLYLITNRVPKGFTGSRETAMAWAAWFEKLGAHLEDRGNPAVAATSLGNCGPETQLGGYTLITARDLNEAIALTSSHPLLDLGGGVEIGQLTQLNEGEHLVADRDRG